MRRSPSLLIWALAGFCSAGLWAQEAGRKASAQRFSPPSGSFACDLPSGWKAFEEEEFSGPAVHILGPDDPTRTYRAGIDIRFMEKGQPGFLALGEELERLRRSDKLTSREATAIEHLRVARVLARLFEVTERRWLPYETLPAAEAAVHHYVALLPVGESYWIIRLSSTRETYLDYRETFRAFVKSFRPSGY